LGLLQAAVPFLICFLPDNQEFGKTTAAYALLSDLGYDWLKINASLNRNIDTLRNEITDFSSAVSFHGTHKCVILDEADYLNAQSFQPALRGFMDDFSDNCGFILTGNYKSRLIPELLERLAIIDFNILPEERNQLCVDFIKRLFYILEVEGIAFHKKEVVEFVMNHAPRWRKILIEVQRCSTSGTFIPGKSTTHDLNDLIKAMRAKQFDDMRRWVAESSVEMDELNRSIYNSVDTLVKQNSIPALVLIMNEAQYRNAFVVDKEIHMVAMLTQLMADVEWN
jgi:hypothetical protein